MCKYLWTSSGSTAEIIICMFVLILLQALNHWMSFTMCFIFAAAEDCLSLMSLSPFWTFFKNMWSWYVFLNCLFLIVSFCFASFCGREVFFAVILHLLTELCDFHARNISPHISEAQALLIT